MKRVGILSDTHGYWDDRYDEHFSSCDEIWHAGDIGSLPLAERLSQIKPLRAVHGNIDGQEIRARYPSLLRFEVEGVEVLLTHIGGYPGRYDPAIARVLRMNPPRLFVCGHSHILKVINDPKLGLLHINPGAAGNFGFHQVRTLIRLSIHEGRMFDLEVVELALRS